MPLEHINEPLADTVNLSNDGFDGFGRRRLSQVEQAAKDLFTSDTDYLQPDFENRQEPAERHLIEVFESATADNEKECQERALEYLESLSPLTQLRLLHVFNQSGYVAHIDGVAYDERDKWIMALQFNSMAKGSSNALVALTSERWESRMRRKSEKLETAELLQYPSGRDLAYRSRIALPEEWVGYAELGYIAPGVIAAKGWQGVISRVAQIDHVPSRLSARDINILHAGYAVSWERKHDYVAYGGESDEISIIGKNLLTPHLEGDDLEFVKRTTSKSKIFERIDRLTESNIELSPQKDDFIDILEVDGFDDDETRAIFQLAHQDGIRDALEGATGIDLASLTLSTQSRLLRYMTSRSKEEFSRIADAAERARPTSGSTSEFYEAFLATEFGDDYGDAILDIAEHAERHQAMHIFETVNTLRVRTGEFAEMFKAIDPKFAHATEKAFNERITDALTALQEVAVKGHLHQDVAPHQKKADYVHDGRFDIAVHSIEEATEIIDGLEKTFGTMHKITTAEDLKITKVNSDETQFVMYRLAGQSAGNMLIYIRPEGAYGHDKQMEYGNRQGVEASISFMVDPLNPRKLLLPKDPDAVSIRFDHEGRLVDEAPNSERRDPTRRDGLISADLSSGMGRASSLAVKIGRFVAAGNRIRANRRGTEDSLHHNTNYFDQGKYGDADGFAHLARSVIRQIELMKKILRSKKIGMAAQVATKTTGSEQVDLPKAA